MTVLQVQAIGKAYRKYKSEWHRVARWFGLPIKPTKENWVLHDISFTMAKAQGIGIIGQNGAGKSTLLKIITGSLAPSTGSIHLGGKVAAILELGMGFNPELTGRQNARHAVGLMGYQHEEVESAIPDIEEFAEIGEYFDQPVRTYSSGMQARLAFAVATFQRPEILIVDEVLAVGDSYFQHKSFSRIREFKEQGTALLFVSHSMGDVKTLCDRVLLLDAGKVIKDGYPDEVVDYYNALIAEKENRKLTIEQRRDKAGWLLSRSGTREAYVKVIKLLDANTGEEITAARVGQQLCLQVTANTKCNLPRLVLGLMLRDRLGHVVWGTNTWHTRQIIEDLEAGDRIVFSLEFPCHLGPGSYSFSPALTSSDTHLENNYEWTDNALVFDVINAQHAVFIGTYWLDARFRIECSKEATA